MKKGANKVDGIKVRAIACGSKDYKESDKLVTLCSVEEGKITVLLKGCRKPTSKLRFAHAPFCFGEYILVERGGFYTVTGCTPIDQFTGLSYDIDKFYAGSVILECLTKFTREGENIARPLVKALEYLKTLCL
jgi:DNA repair protein RecO (recombination protein O)